MRGLYFLRVTFVSFEATTLAAALLVWSYFRPELTIAGSSIASTSDVLKFVLLLPLVLVAWIGNEVRQLLHEDKETTRLLAGWPDYWRLKSHVFSALTYALLFASLSIVPWLLASGINGEVGLLLFVTSLVGQFVVVFSIYTARLKVKEAVALASAA